MIDLRKATNDLLDDIRQGYPELDLAELSRAAGNQYVSFTKEMAAQLGPA